MAITLYYVPRTRAVRPRWVLEELGVPYELVRLDPTKGETRTPEHLARQPLGHVPVIEDGGVRLFESAAICFYLAERYGDGRLLPVPGSAERAGVYQWAFFVATEVEPALAQLVLATSRPEPEQDGAAVAAAKERAGKAILALDRAVRPGGFLAGEAFTVADVMVGSFQGFNRARLAWLAATPPEATGLAAYLARLTARAGFQRATAD